MSVQKTDCLQKLQTCFNILILMLKIDVKVRIHMGYLIIGEEFKMVSDLNLILLVLMYIF